MRSARAQTLDYGYMLFTVDGLAPDVNHTLTLTNLEEGRWFGFDYAEVSNAVTEIKSVTINYTSGIQADIQTKQCHWTTCICTLCKVFGLNQLHSTSRLRRTAAATLWRSTLTRRTRHYQHPLRPPLDYWRLLCGLCRRRLHRLHVRLLSVPIRRNAS